MSRIDIDQIERLAEEHISCQKSHMVISADAVLGLIGLLRTKEAQRGDAREATWDSVEEADELRSALSDVRLLAEKWLVEDRSSDHRDAAEELLETLEGMGEQ